LGGAGFRPNQIGIAAPFEWRVQRAMTDFWIMDAKKRLPLHGESRCDPSTSPTEFLVGNLLNTLISISTKFLHRPPKCGCSASTCQVLGQVFGDGSEMFQMASGPEVHYKQADRSCKLSLIALRHMSSMMVQSHRYGITGSLAHLASNQLGSGSVWTLMWTNSSMQKNKHSSYHLLDN
jgi:hypothetical protein